MQSSIVVLSTDDESVGCSTFVHTSEITHSKKCMNNFVITLHQPMCHCKIVTAVDSVEFTDLPIVLQLLFLLQVIALSLLCLRPVLRFSLALIPSIT